MLTPETSAGTSLEVLAPYLAHKPELASLQYELARYAIESVQMGGDGLYLEVYRTDSLLDYEADNGLETVAFEEVLPVLFPFRALCDELPDGTIPAREILLLIDKSRWTQLFRKYVKRLFIEDESLMMEVDGSAFEIPTYNKLACLRSHIWGEDIRASVADYLRSKHFALPVNGRPLVEGVDYIAKASPKASPGAAAPVLEKEPS